MEIVLWKYNEYENIKKMVDWCWDNLEFNNCPDSWLDTEIVDIVNGCRGTAHTKDGNLITYTKIRMMFETDNDDE